MKGIPYLIFFFFLFSCQGGEEAKGTSASNNTESIIQVKKAPNQNHLLFIDEKISRSFPIFPLRLGQDSVFTKSVNNNEFSVGSLLTSTFNNDSTIVKTIGSFLIRPGDSTMILPNNEIVSNQHKKEQWIDSIINIPSDFYIQNPDPVFRQAATLEKYINLIQSIEKDYQDNQNTLSIIRLPDKDNDVLSKYNAVIKYTRLLRIRIPDNNFSLRNIKDSVYTVVLRSLNRQPLVNYFFNDEIYDNLIYFFAVKNGADKSSRNFWKYFDYTSAEVKSSAFYHEFLYRRLVKNFLYMYKQMPETCKILQQKRVESPVMDSFYQLSQIMLLVRDSFEVAKEQLQHFENGRFLFLLESKKLPENNHITIASLDKTTLHDFYGNTTDLNNIVTEGNHKLTLIDLWASWCAPCIAELPELKRMEKKFAAKGVKFVSISIDKDPEKWKEKAKEKGLYEMPGQYLLPNFENNAFVKAINLRSIPRFIIIDKQGKLVDDNFFRPSSEEFELELLKVLNKGK